MDLTKLHLMSLIQHLDRVGDQLSDPSTRRSLLDAACADTPIIKELVSQIARMMQDPTLPQSKKAVRFMQHDVHILLALREIALEQEGKAEAWLRAAMN
jgi:hypothetical protein